MKDFAVGTKFEPRDYQTRIIQKVTDMFQGKHVVNGHQQPEYKSVVIESPTGSGKTCMTLLSVKEMQKNNPNLFVCWFAFRKNLVRQAARENINKEVFANISFLSAFDTDLTEPIKARAEGREILLVLDEYHHDSCETMATIHNRVRPDKILGVTATLYRADNASLSYQGIVKDAGIHTLIKEGHLSKFDHYSIEDWTPANVAKHYLASPEKWGKSVFYFLNIDLCQQFAQIMTENGVDHELITGKTDDEAQLERFDNDEIKVVINCMKLTEGYDCPSLQTVWIRDGSKGPTVQMGGRVLRKFPGLQKQMVQSIQTKYPFGKVALPKTQYLYKNNDWISLNINPMIEQISLANKVKCAQTIVEMPTFIMKAKEKKRRRTTPATTTPQPE